MSTGPCRPRRPTSAAAVTGSNNQITLSWDPVLEPSSGIDHYNIYRNGALYATSTTTSYTDTSGISPQARYSYQVTAVNLDGVEGQKSTAVTAMPAGIASIVTLTTTSVQVQFTEPVDPTTAKTAANYTINGITISAAVLQADGYTVLLTTSTLGSSSYTLTVSNVKTLTLVALPTLTSTFSYSAPGWSVTVYEANVTLNDTIAMAQTLVNTPSEQSWVKTEVAPYIDYNVTGGVLHFTGEERTLPGTTMGTETDNFAVTATGTLVIPAAGTYTFGCDSDNGFQLTIGGVTFSSVTGEDGGSNTVGTDVLQYNGGRGVADTLGVVTFARAGDYPISLLWFQGNGGAACELYAAAGSYSSFTSAPPFELVGDTTNGGLSLNVTYLAPPFSVGVNALSTNNGSPALSGIVTDPDASVTVRVNGKYYGAVNSGAGTWSLPQGEISSLPAGTYDVVVAGVNTSGVTAFASTINQLTIATTAPTATITAPTSPTFSPLSSIAITFSEPVQNFTLQDLQLTLGNNGGAAASEPLEGATLSTTDNQHWTLGNLSGLTTAAGTYTLSVTGLGSTVTDTYGNPLLTGASTSWTLSNPAVQAINIMDATITKATSVQYMVTFNESVTGVALADFALATTAGGASGTLASVSGSGASYIVTVNNVTGNGPLGLNLGDNNTILDQYGNPLGGPALGDGSFTGQIYTIDTTAPTITIGSPSAAYANSAAQVTYTVTYADANFNTSTLTKSNITLNTTNTATGAVSVSGSGTSYVVTVSGITGDGTLGISIAAGTASDLAGNLAPASAASGTFVVDTTAPTITIGSPSAAYANSAAQVTYTVTYADANFNTSTLTKSNITLNTTNTATGAVSVSGSGTSYVVTVSGITGDGTLGISIAAGTASDLAGNLAAASAASSTFIVDNSGPTVATPASAALNPVTGVATGLFVLGADIATGEASLTYSWAATILPAGATAPKFSVSGTHDAQHTVATFSMWGTYGLTVTITDPFGLKTTSTVTVAVEQTLTSISNTGQPPVATALDQFGDPLASQPIFDPGSDTITGPLTLDNGLTLLPAAGSQLTISGGITGDGRTYGRRSGDGGFQRREWLYRWHYGRLGHARLVPSIGDPRKYQPDGRRGWGLHFRSVSQRWPRGHDHCVQRHARCTIRRYQRDNRRAEFHKFGFFKFALVDTDSGQCLAFRCCSDAQFSVRFRRDW